MADAHNVLIVEDNDFVRMQIAKFLTDGGYICHEAISVAAAMDILHDNPDVMDCMLVDVRMEPEDGFDFLNKLQAEDIQIPSILVTGDQNTDILSNASHLGVFSVLMKPVNKDRLLMVVNKAIASSRRS